MRFLLSYGSYFYIILHDAEILVCLRHAEVHLEIRV